MSTFLIVTISILIYILIGFIHAKIYYKDLEKDLGKTFYEDLSLDHSYTLDKEELRTQASIFGFVWIVFDVFILITLIVFLPFFIYKFLLKKLWK